jgi:hypothetical protein
MFWSYVNIAHHQFKHTKVKITYFSIYYKYQPLPTKNHKCPKISTIKHALGHFPPTMGYLGRGVWPILAAGREA